MFVIDGYIYCAERRLLHIACNGLIEKHSNLCEYSRCGTATSLLCGF